MNDMISPDVLARQLKIVGTRPLRPDGVDKVTGRAQFGADMHLPNMLVGKVLRSPHAHARIKSIDISKAQGLKGVKPMRSAVGIRSGGRDDGELQRHDA
jgi:CO/xanthine dehydrogenase Mo-binding subunit